MNSHTSHSADRLRIGKMILNLVMTVLFALLMKVSFTGLEAHEVIGLMVGFLFLVHNLLNYQWIATALRHLRLLKPAAKLQAITDLILIGSVTLMMIAGVRISEAVLPQFAAADSTVWSNLHHIAAYVTLGGIGVHIFSHAAYIAQVFRRMRQLVRESKARSYAARGASLGMAAFTIALIVLGCNNDPSTENPVYIESSAPAAQSIADQAEISDASGSTNTEDSQIASGQEESLSPAQEEAAQPAVSLEEFLSSMFCSGCGKRCPLTNLRCGKGQAYLEEATAQYEQQYAAVSTSVELMNNETSRVVAG